MHSVLIIDFWCFICTSFFLFGIRKVSILVNECFITKCRPGWNPLPENGQAQPPPTNRTNLG